jgi:hypothetical protein
MNQNCMSTNKPSTDGKIQALLDYVHSDIRTVDIATKHKIPVATLSRWVTEERIARRTRGRKPAIKPSERVQKILTHAGSHGFSDAAKHFSITKQFVSSLAKRWGIRPPQNPNDRPSSQPGSIKIRRRERRNVIVSFRLLDEELSSLRKTLPSSVLQSTRSPHKLARAALLEHLERSRLFSSQSAEQ